MLRGFEDLDQAFTLRIHVCGECSEDLFILQCVLRCLYVIQANGFHNVVVAPVTRFFGGASGAEKAVRRAFKFGVVTASRTNDCGAVMDETIPREDAVLALDFIILNCSSLSA